MATPLTPDQLLAALRKWGVRVNEIDGWRTRGRNYVGHGAWGPVVGCMTHHTADDAPDDTDLRIVRDGRSNLPGPLAQFGGRDDGTIDLIASGRANHAGTGDPAVYAAVSAQSYGVHPPATHYHQGSTGGTDGNARFYGLETYYSGSHAPTDLQYRAAVLLWAAICDAHGWSSKAVIGHKEWSDWKQDPGQVDMRTLRADVAHCLTIGPAAAAAWAYGTTSEEDDMPTAQEIAQAVWEYGIHTSSGDFNAPAGAFVTDTRAIVGGMDGYVRGLPDATAKAVAALGLGGSVDPDALASAIAAALIQGQDVRVTAASPA